jgi:hypothetical protein
MKKLFSFKNISKFLLATFFTVSVLADDQPSTAFRLKRGVGACSNLPTEADNFVCNAIGWPDQNARVDLIRQEFVNKFGMTVRWGLFDYYYYFNGIKKCEPFKETITDYLTTRKDLDDLWQKLGKNAECVRKGQGWIQTRNIELFSGEPFIATKPTATVEAKETPAPVHAPAKQQMEVKLVPEKKKEAKVIPAPIVEKHKPEAKHVEPVKEKRFAASVAPTRNPKKSKVKYDDEEPMTSVPMAPLKRESKQFWSEPFPKEFF